MNTENKNSHFILDLMIYEIHRDSEYMEYLENIIKLVLAGMSSHQEPYKFLTHNKSRFLIFFKTDTRKRNGQLIKLCQKNFIKSQTYETRGVSKDLFFHEIERLKRDEEYQIRHSTETKREMYHYDGLDIKLFNDRNNWYPWQREIYNMIFEEDGSIKEPHTRHIISLIDIAGNSGKSSFFKWILYNSSNEVGRVGSGLFLDLPSSLVNIGAKKIYIIDLARSNSKTEKEKDLLATIEDLKTGVVINTTMFEDTKLLLMEPPQITV